MPFDPMPTNPAIALGHERLRRLSARLREEMPQGFVWTFNEVFAYSAGPPRRFMIDKLFRREAEKCGTVGCAYGLGMLLWPDDFPELEANDGTSIARCAQAMGMSIAKFNWIFGATGNFDHYGEGLGPDDITPVMVADAIDRYLAEGPP